MSKIYDYKRKKEGYKNLGNVCPYECVGIDERGCNMPSYTIRLRTDGSSPECEWFYEAVCELWKEIRDAMKVIGAKDVNKTKGEAAKEAGDFLGLVDIDQALREKP